MHNAIIIHSQDNVAVVIAPIAAGERISAAGRECVAAEPIPQHHKVALAPIAAGAPIVKYGETIGVAARPIAAGQWVHTHNLTSAEE